MGPAGLTAVFGKGTGVAPQVWSPGNRAATMFRVAARNGSIQCSMRDREGQGGVGQRRSGGSDETCFLRSSDRGIRSIAMLGLGQFHRIRPSVAAISWRGEERRRVGVVKPLGC